MTNNHKGVLIEALEALKKADHFKLNEIVKPEVKQAIVSLQAFIDDVPKETEEAVDWYENQRVYDGKYSVRHLADTTHKAAALLSEAVKENNNE